MADRIHTEMKAMEAMGPDTPPDRPGLVSQLQELLPRNNTMLPSRQFGKGLIKARPHQCLHIGH